MLTVPLILMGLLFFWLGWKGRGIYEKRPGWLKWGKKKPAANGTEENASGGNGVVDRFSRTGERILGKGVEAIMGKPKKPKDDKDKP